MLLHQFTGVMILVLVAVAIMSGAVGELKSTWVILAIIIRSHIPR